MKTYFCGGCEQEVETKVIEKEETFEVRGMNITCKSQVRVCQNCKEEIYDPELDNKNIKRFYDKYREMNGLLTGEEIKEIRKKYNLSQVVFAKILGFGEKTIARYENGFLQDRAHDQLIRLVNEEENFKKVWEQVKQSLSDEDNNKIKAYFDKKQIKKPIFDKLLTIKYDDKYLKNVFGYIRLNNKREIS